VSQGFDNPAGESAPTIKWAIFASLVVLVGLVALAPRGGAASIAVPSPIEAGVAPRAEVVSSGYTGPGPRFAQPQGRPMTAYEEAQAWATESHESESSDEAPPTF